MDFGAPGVSKAVGGVSFRSPAAVRQVVEIWVCVRATSVSGDSANGGLASRVIDFLSRCCEQDKGDQDNARQCSACFQSSHGVGFGLGIAIGAKSLPG